MQDFDPEKILHRLRQLGHEWAEKEAAASWLEESRRSARATHAADRLREAGSAAKAEMLAEACDEYREFVRSMVERRKEANLAKVNFDTAKICVELMRTKEASKRAELKALGG